MSEESIHIINARSCFYLDVIKDILEADSDKMFHLIRDDISNLRAVLKKKGIDYDSLRGVLSPSKVRNHKEIILCFEAEAFGNSYGHYIHDLVFPLINKRKNHVIQVGDLIYDEYYDFKITVLDKYLHYSNGCSVDSNHNYYLMYFNNIGQEELDIFEQKLSGINGYIGYCDISFCNPFSDIIADTLVQICIQVKSTVILSHVGGDYSDEDNVNMSWTDYNKYGFNYISINDAWYNTYLEYKIFSSYSDNEDIIMSLNSITSSPEDLKNYEIYIAPEKFEYIKNNKGLIAISGLADLSREEFLQLLNSELNITTLCDMKFIDEFDAVLFATIFEYTNPKTKNKYSFLIAFKYLHSEKRLVITTMF